MEMKKPEKNKSERDRTDWLGVAGTWDMWEHSSTDSETLLTYGKCFHSSQSGDRLVSHSAQTGQGIQLISCFIHLQV